jgi:tetratricopeptide (TPR) repeat protein
MIRIIYCFIGIILIYFSLGCTTTDTSARKVQELPEERLATISNYLLIGDSKKAIEAYEKAVKDAPQTPATQILYARLLILGERINDANAVIDKVLELEPDNTDALFARSMILSVFGEKKKQMEILERIISLDGTHSEALAALGSVYLEGKQEAKAKGLFLKTIQADGKNIFALVGLANISYREKKYQEAKTYFDRAIVIQPDYPFTYSDRAQVNRRLGDLGGALEDLNVAVKLEPDYAYNYYDRGRIYMDQGKREEALNQFDMAIKKDQELFVAYVMRAGLYDEMNNVEKAIKDYEKVIVLKKDYFYAYSLLGTLYLLINENDKAFFMFDTAYSYEKTSPEYVILAALALKKAQKNKEAADYLNKKLPEIQRQTWYYNVVQFFIAPTNDVNAVNAANQEKNKTRRGQILFYLGEQYLLLNKKSLAQTYLLETANIERKGMIEKRLAQNELANFKTK